MTRPTIDPYPCEPFSGSVARIEEYVALMDEDRAPKVRAWIREADRVCRANNALRGEP